MLRHVLFLFAVSTVALVSVSGTAVDEVPEEYKGCNGCWVSTIKQFIPAGEVYPSPTSCEGYYCIGSKAAVEYCGTVAVKRPSYIVSDNSLPYPQCCPKIVNPEQES